MSLTPTMNRAGYGENKAEQAGLLEGFSTNEGPKSSRNKKTSRNARPRVQQPESKKRRKQ